jgi:heme/copper-type cytochrome/quinol oxidase subunit 1
MSATAATNEASDLRDTALDGPELRVRLSKTWGTESGLWGALTTVDHKIIGRRYLITTFVFLFLAGLAAVAMRLQLAQPESKLIGPDLYNQLFTMHGTTMMFLFGVPVGEAFAVYLVPLMVGTRNIAFPRLNAFSYWVFLFGGLFLWISFFLNIGPDVGWFAYVPLSGPEFSPGKRADTWAQMITFTEVAGLAVAIEIVVTVLKQRARHDARPHPAVRVGGVYQLARDHLCPAGGGRRLELPDHGPPDRDPPLQSGRGR